MPKIDSERNFLVVRRQRLPACVWIDERMATPFCAKTVETFCTSTRFEYDRAFAESYRKKLGQLKQTKKNPKNCCKGGVGRDQARYHL